MDKTEIMHHIIILFDTSALKPASDIYFINSQLIKFLDDYSKQLKLELSVNLPEMVRFEREYQMRDYCKKNLTKPIREYGILFNSTIELTQELIEQRIKQLIDETLQKHKIDIIQLEQNVVDWNNIIHDAAFRENNFEPGEKEKGFRDAIIMETCFQFVKPLANNPEVRCIVVIKDGHLKDTIKELLTKNGFKNVSVYQDIDELRSLINTLLDENVSEEVIKDLQPKASTFFFNKLFADQDIETKILLNYKHILDKVPFGYDERTNVRPWYMGESSFLMKEKDNFIWSNKVQLTSIAHRRISVIESPKADLAISGTPYLGASNVTVLGESGSIPSHDLELPQASSLVGTAVGTAYLSSSLPSTLLHYYPQQEITIKGKTIFDIVWSSTSDFEFTEVKEIKCSDGETLWENSLIDVF